MLESSVASLSVTAWVLMKFATAQLEKFTPGLTRSSMKASYSAGSEVD